MDNILETFELTKEFIPAKTFYNLLLHPLQKRKRVIAVDKVTLQVKKREIFCLICPNGAGKTSLIKILSCLILPTRGKAKVGGYDIVREEEKVKAVIGLASGGERSFAGN